MDYYTTIKTKTKQEPTPGKDESDFRVTTLETFNARFSTTKSQAYQKKQENKAYSVEKDELTEIMPAEVLL